MALYVMSSYSISYSKKFTTCRSHDKSNHGEMLSKSGKKLKQDENSKAYVCTMCKCIVPNWYRG